MITPVDELFHEVYEAIAKMKANDNIQSVKVKSCLEHLRSSLEYLANDIYEKLGVMTKGNVYFPYGKKDFINRYLSKIPSTCDKKNALEELITSIQPYHTEEEWLTMMCNLTNDAKHRRPIPLDQEETVIEQEISVAGMNLIRMKGSAGRIQVKNFWVNGFPMQDFTYEKGIMKTYGAGVPINLNVTKEKKIRFHGHDYEVIPFLEKCFEELKTFTRKGYEILESFS